MALYFVVHLALQLCGPCTLLPVTLCLLLVDSGKECCVAELVQSCVIEQVCERDNNQTGALAKNYSSEQLLFLVYILYTG
jgi:hypothetical protein